MAGLAIGEFCAVFVLHLALHLVDCVGPTSVVFGWSSDDELAGREYQYDLNGRAADGDWYFDG